MILAMESGPASKAGHECSIEKARLEAISDGAFVQLGGMATATMADDSALGKHEASEEAETVSLQSWAVVLAMNEGLGEAWE